MTKPPQCERMAGGKSYYQTSKPIKTSSKAGMSLVTVRNESIRYRCLKLYLGMRGLNSQLDFEAFQKKTKIRSLRAVLKNDPEDTAKFDVWNLIFHLNIFYFENIGIPLIDGPIGLQNVVLSVVK